MIFILTLLLTLPVHAGQLVPKYALEKNASVEGAGNAERLYGLEYLHPMGQAMRLKAEFGGWVSRQEDRSSMVYSAVSWGYKVHLPVGLFFEAFVGPGWNSQADSRTGSRFNIHHDLGVGWMDANGWGLGVGFKHISNGGFFPGPNLGRDFLGVRFLIPIG